jgi:LmbE family N-acetylglucosaminyl deacetylase
MGRLLRLFSDASASDGWWPGCPEFALSELPDDPRFRVLLVVAHPDDESECAGALYRIVHEFQGVVDQVVVTAGEGGQHYCTPALEYYGLPDTRSMAKQLPRLRRKEVRRAGRIIGVRRHYFFGQKDNGFTLDPSEGLRSWNLPRLRRELECLMRRERYDLVITLLPSQDTHGHHKTVALLALEAAEALPAERRPAVAGVRSGSSADARRFRFDELPGFPITRTTAAEPAWSFDRRTPLAGNVALDHSIIVHWVIAEHKSQGMFQMEYGRNTHEYFWMFEAGGERRDCVWNVWNRFAAPASDRAQDRVTEAA